MARVFSQLDCVDLLSCSLVCRQWYHDSAELRKEWRKEYLDAWNQFGLSATLEARPNVLPAQSEVCEVYALDLTALFGCSAAILTRQNGALDAIVLEDWYKEICVGTK